MTPTNLDCDDCKMNHQALIHWIEHMHVRLPECWLCCVEILADQDYKFPDLVKV